MPNVKVTEFAFTGYAVTDIARARNFYENVLRLPTGMVFEHEDGSWIEYEVGPHVLAITNAAGENWKPSRDGGGVALEVEDFEEAVAALREAGVTIYQGPMETSVCHMALILDPDGNSICIHKRKAGHN